MPPIFYFACGARPRRRDLELALACGQTAFLVPAGSRAATQLRTIPGVQLVLDSGAWPPNTPERLSRAAYARELRSWCGEAAFAWACTYDTISDAARTQRDHDWLLSQPWPCDEPPIVPIVHYPHGDAGAILADPIATLDMLDAEERRSTALGLQLGAVDGPTDWPACAIGGLAPTRYARGAARWYDRLIAALDAADTLCLCARRIHLLGVRRASWVLRSRLIQSFDSSQPARYAAYGAPTRDGERFGLSEAKLRRSRDARLVYGLCAIRTSVGLPWQALDETLLADDPPKHRIVQIPAYQQLSLNLEAHLEADHAPAQDAALTHSALHSAAAKPNQVRDDSLASAARAATRWNAKQARALPLFHHAGILDQVVAPMTAERQLGRREHFAARYRQVLATYAQGATARIARYKALLATAEAAWDVRGGPKTCAYEADFYWSRLCMVRPDLRWEDV